jgi:hypothetical protein
MLAGGVNRADDLIIHIGFCLLQAMSRSGRSLPFSKRADGLIPSEGAGFVLLKRLDDAVEDRDKIFGVIRAVGLSNDGKGQGLLVPFEKGQVRAINQAYALSGLKPSDISLVEGHATGTPVGDRVEVQSMGKVFRGLRDIPIGTIKSNMGHAITVSGIAGLLKVLGAMEAGVRPKSLNAEDPIGIIPDSPFRLLAENEPWISESPRRAVVNNFGFGGNNAHLIVEQWDRHSFINRVKGRPLAMDDIAIVGRGTIVADAQGVDAFAETLFSGKTRLRSYDGGMMGGLAMPFDLPILGLSFSPADLDQTLPQQLLVLKAAMEAIGEVDHLPCERTGVIIGMGCDAEAARSGLCWRIEGLFRSDGYGTENPEIKAWISFARDRISPMRKAASMAGMVVVSKADRAMMRALFSFAAFTNWSLSTSTPKSTTSNPAPSIIMATRFFPMSCMSPLIVPITTVPMLLFRPADKRGLEDLKTGLHDLSGHEHLGDEKFTRAEPFADHIHGPNQTVVEDGIYFGAGVQLRRCLVWHSCLVKC